MNRSANVYKYLGLFVALVLPLALPLLKFKVSNNTIADALTKECLMWGILGVLLLVARYGEREPVKITTNNMPMLNTIGLSLIIVLSIFVFGMFYGIFYKLLFKGPPAHEAITDRLKLYPIWLKLMIVVRAGILEEIFFRAYGMSRIKQLTNNNFLAFIIPQVFFALGHYSYGTINHVVGTFFIGIILAAYYVQRKNLLANMIGHSIFDLLALTMKSV